MDTKSEPNPASPRRWGLELLLRQAVARGGVPRYVFVQEPIEAILRRVLQAVAQKPAEHSQYPMERVPELTH